MLQLVVTADDLGIDVRRDDGVFEAFDRGAITQASLLVGGRSARTAAERARRDGRTLGLHLDLTEAPASAPASTVASLLDARGDKLGKHGLRDAVARGLVDVGHLAREAEAQLGAFEALMHRPATHVDGHQHVHVIPEFVEALAEVFARAGVRTVRIPAQPVVQGDGGAAHRFYERVSRDAERARTIYARHGIRSTERFIGLDLMGMDGDGGERVRAEVLAVGPARTAELMCHPGYVGTGWDEFNESPAREHELRVLLGRPLESLVASGRLQLTTFATLAERAALGGSA